jgi:hypothetical protein
LLFSGDSSGTLSIFDYPYKNHHFIEKSNDYQECETDDSSLLSINRLEVHCSSETRAYLTAAIDKSIKFFKVHREPGEEGSRYTGKIDSSLEGVHECTINSLSFCSTNSSFISSDDLNLYLWDLSRRDQVFHLVSHKQTVQEIDEVITSSKFHPSHSYEFLWTSTNGTIRVGDLRTKLIMDKPTQSFKYSSSSAWLYEDLVKSISYAEFCKEHCSIVARDYFTVKFWDVRNSSSPYLVTDIVEDKNLTMREVYESQVIYLDFEVKDCFDSEFVVTGGKGEILMISRNNGNIQRLEALTHEFVVHVDVNEEGVAAYAATNCLGLCRVHV